MEGRWGQVKLRVRAYIEHIVPPFSKMSLKSPTQNLLIITFILSPHLISSYNHFQNQLK